MFYFKIRYDWRLKFVNLKTSSDELNTIGAEERETLWIPSLIFNNCPGISNWLEESRSDRQHPFQDLIIFQSLKNSTILGEESLQLFELS